jgi:4,5-DOPA dioxygenase extradiol
MSIKNNHSILYLSHGGGPMPLLGDAGHREMVETLIGIAASIKKPSAIILVSAHWEENTPAITSGATPDLIYDYYGFPKETYELKYPCPGEPLLANQMQKALVNAGIEVNLDAKRGFDHGMFVPLTIMYPDADIPCVQLSLVNNLDPVEHINIGEALESLAYDNLLVIGSGFSFHNMKAFFAPDTDETEKMNASFEDWLKDTCCDTEISEEERKQRLINWAEAPFARYCHPREEHLLPLHICYGLAQTACSVHFPLKILNKKSSMYLW